MSGLLDSEHSRKKLASSSMSVNQLLTSNESAKWLLKSRKNLATIIVSALQYIRLEIKLVSKNALALGLGTTKSSLFLGAISFVKAVAYTREYVKSADYKFKKLAKDYIISIEAICRNSKNGQQLSNDLTTDIIKDTFYNQQRDLIIFLRYAKDKSQLNGWAKYLKKINPNLRITSKSFPRFPSWKELNAKAFVNSSRVQINSYINELLNFVVEEEKTWFKDAIKSLATNLNPRNPSLEKSILNKASSIKKHTFLNNSTKKGIALEIYKEITKPQPTPTDRMKKVVYKPIGFIKDLWPSKK